MKQISLMIGILIAFAGMARAADYSADGYRIFTSKDGRSIEGRIVKYDAQKGKIQIERRGAGVVWVTADVFGETDQTYIQEWVAADLFLSESKLRVTVEKHVRSGSKSKSGSIPEKIGLVYYEVQLNNLSDITFNRLKLDYQLHIGKQLNRGGSALPRCVAAMIKLKSLPAGSKRNCTTKVEKLITKFSSRTSYNPVTDEANSFISKRSKEVVQGVLFRLQGPTVGGVPVIREFSHPADFGKKVVWTEPSLTEFRKKNQKLSYDALIKKAESCAFRGGVETDYVKAIELYQQALDIDSTESAKIEQTIAILRLRMCTWPQIALVEEWAEKNENLILYKNLALLYGSSVHTEFLDGEKAVKYALKAIPLGRGNCKEALAIAYARNGQFDLAVDIQRELIKRLKRSKTINDRTLDRCKFQYKLYKEKRAYTEGMEKEVR